MKIHICGSTVKLQRHKSSEIRVMAQIVQKIVVHSLVCPQMSKSQFGTIVSLPQRYKAGRALDELSRDKIHLFYLGIQVDTINRLILSSALFLLGSLNLSRIS